MGIDSSINTMQRAGLQIDVHVWGEVGHLVLKLTSVYGAVVIVVGVGPRLWCATGEPVVRVTVSHRTAHWRQRAAEHRSGAGRWRGRECAGNVGGVYGHSFGLSSETECVLWNAFTTVHRI